MKYYEDLSYMQDIDYTSTISQYSWDISRDTVLKKIQIFREMLEKSKRHSKKGNVGFKDKRYIGHLSTRKQKVAVRRYLKQVRQVIITEYFKKNNESMKLGVWDSFPPEFSNLPNPFWTNPLRFQKPEIFKIDCAIV